MWQHGYGFEEYEEERYPAADPMVLQATEDLRRFFARRRMPFYLGQLECVFEKKYFHWVTYNAIRQLMEEGFLEAYQAQAAGNPFIFVARAGLPYNPVRRHIVSVVRLLETWSGDELRRIRGKHLEALVKAELRANSFEIVGTDSRSYRDREWTETGHDLDFIAELDNGQAIGVEVKNTIPYIPRDEFDTKLRMCRHLGIRPVFASRWLPKNYIYEAYQAGGFGWLFEYQAYPLGYERLCEQIQRRLHFPAMVMSELPPKPQRLFANWVAKLKGKA